MTFFDWSSDQFVDVLFWLAVGALAVRGLAWRQVKSLWARSWPTVQGTIESATVLTEYTRFGRYYLVQFAYSYAVNGEYYSGNYEEIFLREGTAQRLVDQLRGQVVFVRHAPSRPDYSALLKQDQHGAWPA